VIGGDGHRHAIAELLLQIADKALDLAVGADDRVGRFQRIGTEAVPEVVG
jgi:hypothetical protein